MLSICIPTYNHGKILDLLLKSISEQVGQLDECYRNQLEIIISDNCSNDNTKDIVKSYCDLNENFVYNRNDKNLGFGGNFAKLVSELSSGKYCWVIGDDDLILNGSLKYILDIIAENKMVSYFFVNHCIEDISFRNELIEKKHSKYIPTSMKCYCNDFENGKLTKFEEILPKIVKSIECGITYIGNSIFERNVVLEDIRALDFNNEKGIMGISKSRERFNISFDNVFPHAKIIAKNMICRNCFYIGIPLLLQGMGEQSVGDSWDIIYIKCLYELLKFYKKIGISENALKNFKDAYFKQASSYIFSLIYKNDIEEVNVKQSISDLLKDDEFITQYFLGSLRSVYSNYKSYYKVYAENFYESFLKMEIKDNAKVAIWGTGKVAEDLINYSEFLKGKVLFFVDSDKEKIGKRFFDIEIKGGEEINYYDIDVIIIATVNFEREIVEKIKQIKVNKPIKLITQNGKMEI